jgi:uncharacterized protein YegP (UPF0339 family)
VNERLVDFIDVYEDAAGEWRWRAKSRNGNVVADSGEAYVSRADALAMAKHLFPEAEIREEG